MIFGEGRTHVDPKYGLAQDGPCLLSEQSSRVPHAVNVGIIGTGHTIGLAERWIQKCKQRVDSSDDAPIFRPAFPGFERVFGCDLILLKQWKETVLEREISEVTQIDHFGARIRKGVRLFTDRLRNLSERELRPQVVICALPQEIVDYCGTKDRGKGRIRLTEKERQLRKILEYNRVVGQQTLFPLNDVELGLTDFLSEASDFRRILKAEAMEIGIPVQLAKPSTFTGNDPSSKNPQDEATRAWNFSVALYYKGGGYPWRMADAQEGTCYVGISFYKEHGIRMRTSLAQIFTHTGEGLVLRGDRFEWDPKKGRSPHLTEEGAHRLLSNALKLYDRHLNRLPTRLVVHKSSRYWPGELTGFKKAAAQINRADLLAFGERGIRFLRKGSYPPLRGTVVQLAPRDYLLYTKGYIPLYDTYPGHRIPQPLEIIEHFGDSDPDTICKEILALTKMNWNNAEYNVQEPITLQFSREVGKILSHLREGVDPKPQYFYYM